MKTQINLDRIVKYFRENLGAPFVVLFQLLLVACAIILIRGDSVLANEVAIYAYYSLVVGVVLQLVSFLRHGSGEED